jgi:hypothetical protein
MPTPYRFAGAVLAQAGSIWDVQHQNLGMLELNIDFLVPGGKETLILSIQEFTVPGREMGKGDLPYLAGMVHYPTRVNAMGNISATFRDFPLTKARAVLNKWFRATYDELTGFSLPTGLLKSTGYMVLFQSDATAERAARLEGLWLVKQPETAINFANGEVLTMQVDISVDRVVWENSLDNPI